MIKNLTNSEELNVLTISKRVNYFVKTFLGISWLKVKTVLENCPPAPFFIFNSIAVFQLRRQNFCFHQNKCLSTTNISSKHTCFSGEALSFVSATGLQTKEEETLKRNLQINFV